MASSSVAERRPSPHALVLLGLVIAVSVPGVVSKSLNIINNCNYMVWPGISSSGAGSAAAALDSTGFELAPGESRVMAVPSSGWSGRIWGRTLCSTDATTGNFTCVTGDCGSGCQECGGGNAAPPVTLAQFTLQASGGLDTYDVSLVDGYNIPMLVAVAPPLGGICAPTGCVRDLNGACPAELRVASAATGTVACKSACLAFGSPQYCCTGEYGTPSNCKPSAYSELFKKACPRASSYAYDGAGSTIFTCGGGYITTYTITFCPTTTNSPNSQLPVGNLPNTDATTAYTSGSQVGTSTAASTPWRIALIVGVLGAVTAGLGLLATFLGLFGYCCNCELDGAGGGRASTDAPSTNAASTSATGSGGRTTSGDTRGPDDGPGVAEEVQIPLAKVVAALEIDAPDSRGHTASPQRTPLQEDDSHKLDPLQHAQEILMKKAGAT